MSNVNVKYISAVNDKVKLLKEIGEQSIIPRIGDHVELPLETHNNGTINHMYKVVSVSWQYLEPIPMVVIVVQI